ncbi:MAG: aspartyl protease family protein [Proteobacteria bacterium]|nr:aspartyl protease family protein [Pseudomonadota bacterium]
MKALTGLALGVAAVWSVSTFHQADAAPQDEARAEAPSAVDLPATGAAVPLMEADTHPVVEVTIHGEKFRFLVETGAWFNSISADAAERLRLPERKGEATIDTLAAGPAVFHGLKARVLDHQPGDVDGQLGLPAFADLLATVDFPHHELRLAKGDLPEVNGKDVLPLQSIGPLWGVPMTVGDRSFVALIDTQSGDGLAIAPPLARTISFAGKPVETGRVQGPAIGEAAVQTARLSGSVKIGSYRFDKPMVSSFPVELRFQNLGVWLGPSMLKNFTVTLDQKNRRVRFVHVEGKTEIDAPPSMGDFGFRVSRAPDGKVRVNDVAPGGDAERAGVSRGDTLVALDDKPADGYYSESTWRDLTGRTSPVRFRVSHRGVEHDVEVKPTIWIQ